MFSSADARQVLRCYFETKAHKGNTLVRNFWPNNQGIAVDITIRVVAIGHDNFSCFNLYARYILALNIRSRREPSGDVVRRELIVIILIFGNSRLRSPRKIQSFENLCTCCVVSIVGN